MTTESKPNKHSKPAAQRADVNGLIPLAKKAYAEKRRKDCLALCTAILKIDPSNPDARRFQTQIQADIENALQQVESLIHDPLWDKDDILRKNANRLLQSVLEIDPKIKAAESLLAKLHPAASRPTPSAPPRDPFAGRGVEHSVPQSEPAEWDHPPQPNPWIRRLLVLIPVILILLAVLIHYW